MRILLIDDEPLLLKSLKRYLGGVCGHDVVCAGSGREALAEFEADDDVDVIFCDLTMPDIDGVDVCVAIRRSSGIPILVLSARGAERDKVRGQKAATAAQVDALQASDSEVDRALQALDDNVRGQQAAYADAQRAASEAERQAEEARHAARRALGPAGGCGIATDPIYNAARLAGRAGVWIPAAGPSWLICNVLHAPAGARWRGRGRRSP